MDGTATSQIDFSPERIYVNDLKQGESRTDVVELVCKSEEPMNLMGVASSSPLITASVETVEEGRRYRISLTATNTLPRGLTSGRVNIRTDHKAGQGLSFPFHYQVIGELVVAPQQITFREEKDKTINRNVVVRPGLVKEFTVERVEAPAPEIKVDVREMGAYGYQVQFNNIPATMDMNGKEVLIVTSVEPMREIRIPFRVIPSR